VLKLRAIVTTLTALLVSCAALPLSPVISEVKVVHATHDEAKRVTIRDGMVFYDGPAKTRGLRFPPGVYSLEAEDDGYWYFRSTMQLELRVFRDGKVVDSHNETGGLMLRKSPIAATAGGAYLDNDGTSKLMVWKLGDEFLQQQGRYWSRSF
jgi:hypothetical protein